MTTLLVDTHTHLYDPVFDTDRSAILDDAQRVGVGAVITVSEDIHDAKRNLALANRHKLVRPAAGLYPTILDMDQADRLEAFIRAHQRGLVAIGEVGLDYWKVTQERDKELQRNIFARFIKLSQELDLPLNVHSRSAGHHAVTLLLKSGAAKVQMHAFDGKASSALPAVEAGYFFSIPPSIVRSRQKQKLVGRLPLTCLLVETDSPVLGPDPGIRNVPANLPIPIGVIAEIKRIDPAAVIDQVADNTRRLYGNITTIHP